MDRAIGGAVGRAAARRPPVDRILEAEYSAGPELQLTFRIHTGEGLIVRQIIGLRLEDGRWRATSTDIETAHLLR